MFDKPIGIRHLEITWDVVMYHHVHHLPLYLCPRFFSLINLSSHSMRCFLIWAEFSIDPALNLAHSFHPYPLTYITLIPVIISG